MLKVFYLDQLVGHVQADAEGPRFTYAPAWRDNPQAFPISVTMPLSQAEVEPDRFLTWATNLLPEADQLTTVSQRLGIASGDVLGLLEEIGRDTAGALSFGDTGARDTSAWQPIANKADLERIIEELPRKPFLAGEDGVSMSLAGVQSKIAVACDDNGQLYIPLNGSPSTHILKPDSNRLWGSVPNEAFCLTLAKRCGLNVPAVTTGRAGRRSYLLIERYDRVRDGANWDRVHQEDFCQVLGLPPSMKYERYRSGPKGPRLVDMLAAVGRHALAPDRLTLLDAAVFNILACNSDAHAKNYSLMIARDRARMAPLYDVMCASVFDGISTNLAQSIATKTRGDHLKRRHWLRFIEAAGLGPSPTLRRIQALAQRVLKQLPAAQTEVAAMPAGGVGLEEVSAAIAARTRAVLAGLEDLSGTGD